MNLTRKWIRPAFFRKETGISEASYYRLKRSGALRTARLNGLVFIDIGNFNRDLDALIPTGKGAPE